MSYTNDATIVVGCFASQLTEELRDELEASDDFLRYVQSYDDDPDALFGFVMEEGRITNLSVFVSQIEAWQEEFKALTGLTAFVTLKNSWM